MSDSNFDTATEDRIYQDGKEDLAHQLVELIRQSDYEITPYELEEFLEAEIGWPQE